MAGVAAVPAVSAATPTLSRIVNWDVEHLEVAARDWTTVAAEWEHHFTAAHQGTFDPGGTEWDGNAAEAAQERALADLIKVRAAADKLYDAASVARTGAAELNFAKQQVLTSIRKAQGSGFDVTEELSLISRQHFTSGPAMTAKMLEGQALSTEIRTRAAHLVALDTEIASKITTTVAPLDTVTFPESPGNGVQLVDFKQEPPLDSQYPTNEVIAEATDLDGNRVLLRRGYYDGKRGFGWDKIFHKHGVTNPGVFEDLITHSRPISKKDGELVYEVPINRARCTSHLGGLYTTCDDTGESLTMVIVVDTTENRSDVPDGRQKGVITMYPLPGGSGVVEVGPNWTMAPPWVSNNVPIN